MNAFIALLTFLCIAFYACQSLCNKLYSVKYEGSPAVATTVFAAISGLICAAANWVMNGFAFQAGLITWVFGALNGVVLFLFRYAVVNASRTGPFSFQSLMSTFGNILFPLFFNLLFWQDRLSALQLVGIAVMLVSFVLFNFKGLSLSGSTKKYFLWVALQSLMNGFYGILLDSQQRAMRQAERNEMIIITFLVSALISLIMLAAKEKKAVFQAFRMNRVSAVAALASSFAGVIAVNILVITISKMDTSVFYTIENGGVLSVSVLLGSLLFREKLDRYKICGLFCAVISLALLGS